MAFFRALGILTSTFNELPLFFTNEVEADGKEDNEVEWIYILYTQETWGIQILTFLILITPLRYLLLQPALLYNNLFDTRDFTRISIFNKISAFGYDLSLSAGIYIWQVDVGYTFNPSFTAEF